MNKTKILLFLPVLALLGWTLSVQSMISGGTRLDMPIRGYDPRDILAGNYLSVTVDYDGFSSECTVDDKSEDRRLRWEKRDAFFCAETGKIVLGKPENCKTFIKGYCMYNRFHDDVSRFYVSEKTAGRLEKAIRNRENNPMLRLSVTQDGRAFPVDLILQGIPYKEWLQSK
ncbi:MAG: GDYXXLXY domain-containing protein [Alphaproteobacteria bacterium]|nr:GDYXXLXY domain-containing protein [Alphaproteobacteria bacterium]MBO4644276.1 GDYXXLXY domain-containing protein [Alphaproteobacteria bacterium]